MRDIRFRSWEKISASMFYSDDGRWFYFEMSPIGGNGIRDMKWNDLEGIFSEWMQFTWLLDKNWKEIYEGDIVRDYLAPSPANPSTWLLFFAGWEKIWPVKFSDIHHAYIIDYERWPTPHKWEMMHGREHCQEVIWNIYENPELLKK